MEEVRFGASDDEGDCALNEVILRNHQDLRFSNFLLTISTNTAPESNFERGVLAEWLRRVSEEIFDDWDTVNGTVLKPAGSPNNEGHTLGNDHRVVGVRSRVSLERGEDRGFYHAHVLLEVSHTYTEHNQWGQIGVHVNVASLRAFLNARIYRMAAGGMAPARLPPRIYVNSRLLTKGTDNSNKWLTLQYINKTSVDRYDRNGVDIVAQRNAGSDEDKSIRDGMLNPVEESNLDEHDTGYNSPPPASPPRPAAVAPTVIDQRPRGGPPAVAPGVKTVTSAANVPNMPRMRRAVKKLNL